MRLSRLGRVREEHTTMTGLHKAFRCVLSSRQALVAALLFFAACGSAAAHTLGQGYLMVDARPDGISGHVEVTLEDLDKALDIDGDGDGKVTDAELEASMPRVLDYLRERIGIGAEGNAFDLVFGDYEIDNLPLGRYLIANYSSGPQTVPPVIHLRYELIFDVDPDHRGFLVVTGNAFSDHVNKGEETSLVFAPDNRTQTFDLRETSRWRSFTAFVGQGIWHIWIGIDHILFLLALILPAVLRREDGQWTGDLTYRSALWNVVKIVTLFTIAHTITLTLAALDIVTLPPRFVESIIALSVVIAALNNIYPIMHGHMGWLVFGFGLFHGFGFASVLAHLVSNTRNLVVDLLGFNVGVEIGQVAVVAVLLPVLFVLSRRNVYTRAIVPVCSILIALLALGWFTERAFDIDVLPI